MGMSEAFVTARLLPKLSPGLHSPQGSQPNKLPIAIPSRRLLEHPTCDKGQDTEHMALF